MSEFSPDNHRSARTLVSFFGAWAFALPVAAQQHAHAHGRMALDVAVDAQSITLAIESPLDGFLGFERAPRNDSERKRVADMVARLKAADQLFQPDPTAGCKLSKVSLDSAVLGLGDARKAVEDERGPTHAGKVPHAEDKHADIDVDIVFTCVKAADARFIDVRLFDAFKRMRTIDTQVASPQGQFKRSLRPGASRLSLVR